MFKPHRILLAAALFAMAATSSMAGTLGAGGLQGGGGAVTFAPPGSNLFTATELTVNSAYNITGAYDSLAALIPGASTTPVVLDVNAIGSYSLVVNSADSLHQFVFNNATLISDTTAGSPTLGSRTFILSGDATLDGQLKGQGEIVIGFTVARDGRISTSFSLNVTPIPEPSSVALAGIGLAAAGLFGLRKRLAK